MFKALSVSVVLVIITCFHATLFAETPKPSQMKKVPASVTAQIVALKGNLVTIRNTQGVTKTLELSSAKGLAVGHQTGWCEEDCGHITVGSKKYQVLRVMPARR